MHLNGLRAPIASAAVSIGLFGAVGAAHAGGLMSFNVDFGTGAGKPLPDFAGAGGQTGSWFTVADFNEGGSEIANILDEEVGVFVDASLPFGAASFDHPSTTRGFGALLDDYLDLHSVPSQVFVTGLSAGTYDIYIYAWAPDVPAFATSVSIQDEIVGTIGGAWPGGFVEGTTHAYRRVTLGADEQLAIGLFGVGKGTLNGMQIVSVPTPSALAATGLGLLAGGRRRRR